MGNQQTSTLFSTRLLEYRIRKGWSQATLAGKIGVDEETVRRWEKGETRPNKYAQQKLREVFEATSEELGLHENPRLKRTTLAPTARTMPVGYPGEYTSLNPQSSPIGLQEQTYTPAHTSRSFLSGRKKLFAFSSVCLVLVLCLLALWRSNVFPGMSYKAEVSPTPSANVPYHIVYSFENGADQWFFQGPILHIQSSTDYARDGHHSLKVTFLSYQEQQIYPFVEAAPPSAAPILARQTLRMSFYVPTDSPIVSVHPFVINQRGAWLNDSAATRVPSHRWVDVNYTVPSTAIGPITRVGVQLGSIPSGVTSTIYVDAV